MIDLQRIGKYIESSAGNTSERDFVLEQVAVLEGAFAELLPLLTRCEKEGSRFTSLEVELWKEDMHALIALLPPQKEEVVVPLGDIVCPTKYITIEEAKEIWPACDNVDLDAPVKIELPGIGIRNKKYREAQIEKNMAISRASDSLTEK